MVRMNTDSSDHKEKLYHDTNRKTRAVEPGMWLWRWHMPTTKEKLGLGWTGLLNVLERIGESAVKIQSKGKAL